MSEKTELMIEIGAGAFRYDSIQSVSKGNKPGTVLVTFLDSEQSVTVASEDPKGDVQKAREKVNSEIQKQIDAQYKAMEKQQSRRSLSGAPQF